MFNAFGFSHVDILLAMVLSLVALTGGSVVGLAAVWAGLGRPHWFWRIAAIQMLISLPLAIPAFELILWFYTQSAVTILTLALYRMRNARRQPVGSIDTVEGPRVAGRRLQWSLCDVLLLFVPVAVFMTTAVRIPSEVWASWLPFVLIGLNESAPRLRVISNVYTPSFSESVCSHAFFAGAIRASHAGSP